MTKSSEHYTVWSKRLKGMNIIRGDKKLKEVNIIQGDQKD
jgi:hypothetical protein